MTQSSLLAREHASFAAMSASSSMSGSAAAFFPSVTTGEFSLSPASASFFAFAFAAAAVGSTVNFTASAAARERR